jgi:two-component system sensor histidine kinase KdpD
LDRLAALVDNLLDMSRLQAGALAFTPQPVALEEVLEGTLHGVGPDGDRVVVDVEEPLPLVEADAGLLERVIANLLVNALRYSPADQPPRILCSAFEGRVELRVVDRGPGIPPGQRDQMFLPFQRLGDTDNTVGVGLGLALARGLTEVMGGTLEPEETPGGGLTMVVSLVAVPPTSPTPGQRERQELVP